LAVLYTHTKKINTLIFRISSGAAAAHALAVVNAARRRQTWHIFTAPSGAYIQQ
jgi:hypothetical protein